MKRKRDPPVMIVSVSMQRRIWEIFRTEIFPAPRKPAVVCVRARDKRTDKETTS